MKMPICSHAVEMLADAGASRWERVQLQSLECVALQTTHISTAPFRAGNRHRSPRLAVWKG